MGSCCSCSSRSQSQQSQQQQQQQQQSNGVQGVGQQIQSWNRSTQSSQMDKKRMKVQLTKKQMMNEKKRQNDMINQWLGQYKGISFQIEMFKEQLLSRMEHQKRYRNYSLDKLYCECYYRSLVQHDELFTLSKNIKDLSKKLETLVKKSSEKDRYSNANCELVEELCLCIEGFSPFITIAERIPILPENQVTQVKTIQDLIPVLTTSQSMC